MGTKPTHRHTDTAPHPEHTMKQRQQQQQPHVIHAALGGGFSSCRNTTPNTEGSFFESRAKQETNDAESWGRRVSAVPPWTRKKMGIFFVCLFSPPCRLSRYLFDRRNRKRDPHTHTLDTGLLCLFISPWTTRVGARVPWHADNKRTNQHARVPRWNGAVYVFLFFFGTTQWTNVKPLLMELLSLSSSSSHTHTRARTHRLSLFHWKKPRPLSVAKAPPLPFPARPGTPPTCPIKKKKKQINVEETNVVHFAHTQPHTRWKKNEFFDNNKKNTMTSVIFARFAFSL